MIILGS